MNMSRFFTISSSVVLVAGLAACAAPMSQQPVSTYPASTYPTSTYPTTQYPTQGSNYVEYGRVNNVEVIRSQDQARGSGLGAVLGGVAGAVVGSQIGGGSGRDLATVAGAVGGAVAGNAIEKNRASNTNVRETYRVSVQMDNGTLRAYDVPSYGELRIGDRVKVENNQLYRIM